MLTSSWIRLARKLDILKAAQSVGVVLLHPASPERRVRNGLAAEFFDQLSSMSLPARRSRLGLIVRTISVAQGQVKVGWPAELGHAALCLAQSPSRSRVSRQDHPRAISSAIRWNTGTAAANAETLTASWGVCATAMSPGPITRHGASACSSEASVP